MERRFKVTKPKHVPKAWGYEKWIHNDTDYCGKILHFNKGGEFSMHYHVIKNETWFVAKGHLLLFGIDPDTTESYSQLLYAGDVIEVKAGMTHQLKAIQESDIFEISTQHFDEDSYRVIAGDSQK